MGPNRSFVVHISWPTNQGSLLRLQATSLIWSFSALLLRSSDATIGSVLKAWLQETRNKLTSILEYIMRAIKVHVVRIYYSFGDGECLYSWGKLALIISLFPMLLVWNQIGEQMHIINLEMVDKDNIHVKLYTLGLGNYAYNTWYFSVSMEISIKNQLCLEYVVWIRCLHNDFCSCSLIVTSNLSGMSR